LVVGQDGWPLRRDGRLSKNLLKAQSLQRDGHAIAILSEDEFLTKLGLDSGTSGISRLYSTAELTRILKVQRDRLRAWVNAGMIQPVEMRHGISYFDFRQVAAAKSLLKLTQAGVGLLRISSSLRKLQALMNAAETPLAQLAIIEKDGQMAVRLDAGQLVDTTGQL